jgi:hypothetical protein
MYTRQFRHELERRYGMQSADGSVIVEDPDLGDAAAPSLAA